VRSSLCLSIKQMGILLIIELLANDLYPTPNTIPISAPQKLQIICKAMPRRFLDHVLATICCPEALTSCFTLSCTLQPRLSSSASLATALVNVCVSDGIEEAMSVQRELDKLASENTFSASLHLLELFLKDIRFASNSPFPCLNLRLKLRNHIPLRLSCVFELL
jgi:hypothetical protein